MSYIIVDIATAIRTSTDIKLGKQEHDSHSAERTPYFKGVGSALGAR